MKLRRPSAARLSFPLAAAIAALLAAPFASAVSLFWDGTDSTADADGGAGTWNTTTNNWDSAATAGTNQIWNNATPDSATFRGTAGTVTLGTNIITSGLAFTNTSGSYTVTGGATKNAIATIGSVTVSTASGGGASITAPLVVNASTVTMTMASSLSVSKLILVGAGTASILSPDTQNVTVGSINGFAHPITLQGAGGGEVTGIMSLSNAAVTKTGAGTWTISNSGNFWLGTTTISLGTLKMGNSNVLGYGTTSASASSALAFANAVASLDLNGFNETVGLVTGGGATGGTVTNSLGSTTATLTIGAGVAATGTFTGKIVDTGTGLVALTKIGNGTQTLNGSISNTFSGGLNLNGGTLLLDNVNMATPTDLVGNTNAPSLSGGTLSVKGKSTLATSQTLGNVTVNAGGGQIIGDKNGGASNTITLGTLVTSAAGGSLVVGASGSNANLPVITTSTNQDAQGIYGGRVVYYNGTANTGYDWAAATGAGPYTLGAYSSYDPTLPTSGGLSSTNYGIAAGVTLSGDLAANSLKIVGSGTALDLAANKLTIESGGLLSTGTSAQAINGTVGATRLTASNGSGAYDLVVHQFNSAGLTIGAVIGDGAASTSLTKAGTGKLTLSGDNTYTGRTYVNNGILNVTGSSATSGTTLSPAGILSLTNASGLGSGDLTINGGTFFNNNVSGTLTINNALNINKDFTYDGSGGTLLQQTGDITLSRNVNIIVGYAVTLNGNISGTGGFTKAGNGTQLTLGGTNTYTGATVVSAGTLQLNGSLASTNVRVGFGNAGATLTLGGSNLMSSATQLAVDGQGACAFNMSGFSQTLSTLMFGSNSGATKAVVSGSGSTLTLTNGIITSNHNNGAGGNISVTTLDLNGSIQNFTIGTHTTQAGNYDDLLISSVIQNGGINIVGTSTTAALAANCAVTLTGANTYSGATTITAGKLYIGNQLALQNSPLDTTGAGIAILGVAPNANSAIVVPAAGPYTFGGLTGSKNLFSVITVNPTSLNNLILNPGLAQSYSYSGIIANGAAAMTLTKSGAGTQTLSGVNAYTGTTTISGGTLLVNSPGSLNASSAVTVGTGSGGTLGGTGTINGSVTVAADGSIAPGASAGTLSIGGNLDISAQAAGTGKLKFELDALANTNDKIAVTGTLTIGVGALGFSDFTFTNLGGLQVTGGTPYKLITSGGITALNTLDPANLTGLLPGGLLTGTLQISGNDIELVVTLSNTAPTISDVTNLSIPSGGTTGPLSVTVGDAETAVGSLVVTGSSSNTTLVPNANVVIGGSGASRTVTVTPVSGLTGTSTITVTVDDGILTTSDTFVLTVTDNYLSWATANSVTGGVNGDSDNDGVKNLVEYALVDGGERGVLSGNTITFTKRGTPYGSDLTYIIETSETLDSGSWTDAVTHGPGLLISNPTISYTFTPSTPVKNFARLRVVITP